jgi:hypothetical protein
MMNKRTHNQSNSINASSSLVKGHSLAYRHPASSDYEDGFCLVILAQQPLMIIKTVARLSS